MHICNFPMPRAVSAEQLAAAKDIISNPDRYAHRPHIFGHAWTTAKAARGQRVVQSRLPRLLPGGVA